MNTTATGLAFEKEIAELYQLMGFDVLHNTSIDGQQVDILTSIRINGSGTFRQIIECKYKSNNASVSNDDVQSIGSFFVLSKVKQHISACVIVTNSSFSPKAKEVAQASGIILKTKDQLISELIDFKPYLDRVQQNFYTSFGTPEQNWYIQTKVKTKGKRTTYLVDHVDNWLHAKTRHPLAIKGGYGTGKSSFCQYYASKLITSGTGMIPVILQLRDFQKAIKLESLIRDFLDEECQVQNPRNEIFKRMYEEGKILLFLDGFDEMAAKVDSTVLESNLAEIEKYARIGNVIVTCRPEYFISTSEELNAWAPHNNFLSERLSIYEVVEIKEWDAKQITDYVTRRLSQDSDAARLKQCLSCIKALPELSDLSTRAVHLELIVKMLPVMIEKGIPINRPNLYKTYIQAELVREVVKNKRLRVISDEDRFNLMKAIAIHAELAKVDINFQTVYKVIEETICFQKGEMEAVTRDFLNRSFLFRRGDEYVFAHKSIYEYLIAVHLSEQILQGNLQLLQRPYDAAITSMTLELLGGVENFATILTLLKLDDDTSIAKKEDFVKVLYKFSFVGLGTLDFLVKMDKEGYEIADDACNLACMFSIILNGSTINDYKDESYSRAHKYWKEYKTLMTRLLEQSSKLKPVIMG